MSGDHNMYCSANVADNPGVQGLAQLGRNALERIAELEAELMEQARVNGMGSEREAKLMARVERLERALDVALEALEKHSTSLLNHEDEHAEAIAKLKEVRRD